MNTQVRYVTDNVTNNVTDNVIDNVTNKKQESCVKLSTGFDEKVTCSNLPIQGAILL